jgi:uncharacterized protein (DUF1501 family)
MSVIPLSRRTFLRAGLAGLGAGIGSGLGAAPLWPMQARAGSPMVSKAAPDSGPILVVVELAGGNDGLNTIIPYRDDVYHHSRPKLAIRKENVIRIHDEFGFHPRLIGLRNLWRKDKVAIVHGCGYPEPTRSHFSSMEYWHTGCPHTGEPLGWVGRLADARWPGERRGTLVNISERESLAVRSAQHAPIVFSDPRTFIRRSGSGADDVYREMIRNRGESGSATLAYLRDIARTAEESSRVVRQATSSYQTSTSYGSSVANLGRDLRNVAALLRADFPARIYYLSMPGFDTHSGQSQHQANLLMYLGDALEGFMNDLENLGRCDDVAILVFTEFGRRVA